MDWIFVIGPAVGALIGGIFGSMKGGGAFHRMYGSGIGSRIGGGSGWTYWYIVMGALWGVSLAFAYREIHKKGDTATGEFYTDTKEYKKRIKEKEKSEQKEKPDQKD